MTAPSSCPVLEATHGGLALAWTLAALAVAANVAGYAFDLYAWAWWFDRVLHAGTILALTFWLALLVCARALHPELGRGALAVLLLASVGVALGAVWEVAEWAADLVLPGDVIKGKYDTILDVIMNTIGAVAAAIVALRFLRPRPAR